MGLIVDEKKEFWKDLKDYEGIYQISTFGRIFSFYGNDFLVGQLTKKGYWSYQLTKNGILNAKLAHRLVALTYLKNPKNKRTVNHKDGNKLNCYYKNLEWNTYLENNLHALRTCLRVNKKGHVVERTNVLDQTTNKIYINISECAKEFKVNPVTLNRYLHGKRKNKFPQLKLI